MVRRKSLAGIEGEMAALSVCMWSCSAYHSDGVLERAISMEQVTLYTNVTAWSCLDVNRLPSVTSTIGHLWICACASALRYLSTCNYCPCRSWRVQVNARESQQWPTYVNDFPGPHTCARGAMYVIVAFLKCYSYRLAQNWIPGSTISCLTSCSAINPWPLDYQFPDCYNSEGGDDNHHLHTIYWQRVYNIQFMYAWSTLLRVRIRWDGGHKASHCEELLVLTVAVVAGN